MQLGGMRNLSSRAGSQASSSVPEQHPLGGQQPADAGVARVGDVRPAACQLPYRPGVERPEAKVAVALRVIGVEEPGELGCRLVWRQPEAFSLELEAGAGCA